MGKLRLLLDTNIYGIMIEREPCLAEAVADCNKIIVYGNPVIRNELRKISKKRKTRGQHSLRIMLLNNFDLIVGKHVIPLTKKTEELADEYFKEFKKNGGVQSWREMKNDFLIVASATLKDLDLVISEDNKTMLSTKAMESYKISNGRIFLRTPTFFNFEDFKKIVSSCDT